jgi:beta-N-acetylhexosaminidase
VDEVSLDNLRLAYLPPFQEGLAAGAPAMMIGHIAYPSIDGSILPASQSITMVQLLRQDTGFQGVILSDALRMKAATGASGDVAGAALRSIQAGVDLLLIDRPEDALAARDHLLASAQGGALDIARVDEAVRRILSLKAGWGLMGFPLPEASFPDWAANQDLADAIGRRSVALLKDDADIVPLPQNLRRVLVVAPGSEWDLYPALEAALRLRGHEVEFVHYPPPWQGRVDAAELLDELPARLADFDAVLVFTWQAHLNRLGFGDLWQAALVPRLLKTGVTLVVVAIKSPTDLLEFPQVGTYLAMFGGTPGQEGALIDALTGQAAPQGLNPLPALMP